MTESNATILIPDISGFTKFMTTTELAHSSQAINILIEKIVNTVEKEYEVSEIEGDAVLLIRKGTAPSKKELLDTCLRIFNGFHFQREWLQHYAVCPCEACKAIRHLSLKFIVHYGPLAEMKVGQFVKQSGAEMIIAHRLLKNNVGHDEYVLLSEKFLKHASDSTETIEMDWTDSFEEYPSIGTIAYSYALLEKQRQNVPLPPVIENYYTDDTSFFEITVTANFHDIYMAIMNIPERADWVPGLQKVEQDVPFVFVGSSHLCTFDDYDVIVSPLRMTASDDRIVYAESCQIKKMSLSLVHEFVIKKVSDDISIFATRLMNVDEHPIPEALHKILFEKMERMAHQIKMDFET
jgi:hypothetical protein